MFVFVINIFEHWNSNKTEIKIGDIFFFVYKKNELKKN